MLNSPLWMVRAGESAFLIDDFLRQNIIAIGWNELGDLSQCRTLQELKTQFKATYPEATPGQVANNAGQIYRFLKEIIPGQQVITYNPETRNYHIGTVSTEYRYSPNKIDYVHHKSVDWQREISRDSLSTSTKNTLGAIQSIFSINGEAQSEIFGPGIRTC